MRLLHTGDWHLSNRGTVAGRYVMRSGVNLTLWDKAEAIRRICDYAEEDRFDLIVIPGDLFDHPNPENVAIEIAVEAIERLSEQAPVVVVKGNHDGGKGSEFANALAPFGRSLRKFGIYVSNRPEIIPILSKGRKIQIFTLPYPRKAALRSDPQYKNLTPEELSRLVGFKLEEILSGFTTSIEHDALNVLAGHFTVAGGMYSKEQTVPPFDVSVRREFVEKFDLALLSHLHEPQQFYSGTITRSGFGEEGTKVGFKVYDVQEDDHLGWGRIDEEFVELPGREYLTIDVHEFLKNGAGKLAGKSPETIVRVKGKVKRHEYDDVVRKLKALSLLFVKNAVEVEPEVVRAEGVDVAQEPSVEEAVRLWANGKEGTDKFLDSLIEVVKQVEYKWKVGKGVEDAI